MSAHVRMLSGEGLHGHPRSGGALTSPAPARWIEPGVLVLAGLLAVLFALRIPQGLPYDEPAHWANVVFYAQHLRLPVMGVDHVSYEAQQTPVFYALAALIVRIVGEEHGWLAVRLLGAVGHVLMVALLGRILRTALPRAGWAVVAGSLFVAVNPMLLTMSGSIQNDTLALVFILAATLVAVRSAVPGWGSTIALGTLSGLAILTKFSMIPAAVALIIWLLVRRRPARAAVAAAAVGLLDAWWIVRNVLLYGDLTGQAGVALTGARFGNVDVGAVYLARTVATYLVLPTEYLRNTIAAPFLVDVTVIAVVLLVFAGLIWLVLHRAPHVDLRPLVVIAGVAVLSVGAWLGEVLLAWPVAFRTAYASLPLFALGAGGAVMMVGRRARPLVLGCLILFLLGIAGWVLGAVSHVRGLGL